MSEEQENSNPIFDLIADWRKEGKSDEDITQAFFYAYQNGKMNIHDFLVLAKYLGFEPSQKFLDEHREELAQYGDENGVQPGDPSEHSKPKKDKKK
jgi:hypothetical protein